MAPPNSQAVVNCAQSTIYAQGEDRPRLTSSKLAPRDASPEKAGAGVQVAVVRADARWALVMPLPPAFRAPALLQLAASNDNTLSLPKTNPEAMMFALTLAVCVVFLSPNTARGDLTLGPLLLTMIAGGF